MTLGQYIRKWRMDVLKMSARTFCLKHNISSNRWMVLESDLAKPSSFEALASVLDIQEHMDAYRELQALYFAHEPRSLSAEEMNGMMPAICLLDKGQRESLRQSLQEQMHTTIAGTHAI